VEREALLGTTLGVLVSRIVAEDDVHCLSGWHLRLDGIEEADEFLMPVTLYVAANRGAIERVIGDAGYQLGTRAARWRPP
jgi:hypothetical protein